METTTRIITPKSAIELVLARKTKDADFSSSNTKLEKWLLNGALLLIVATLITGAANYYAKDASVKLIAMLMLLLAVLFAGLYQIATFIRELKKMRNVEREMANPLLVSFNNDVELINELASDYENHHLEYAKTCFTRMAMQLKQRTSLMVGAIESVGLIPLV
ncbi:MAG TPA: hypothetical protein VFV64_06340, partial [Permianibacter sp.]|nr:hypothetical protein [Permianibacter sp.]